MVMVFWSEHKLNMCLTCLNTDLTLSEIRLGTPGSTPSPGPFAACHSPSLTLFPVFVLTFSENSSCLNMKQYVSNMKTQVTSTG